MVEVHLKSNGSKNYIIPAGYMNRAARRKWKKIMRQDRKHKGVRIY